MTSFLDTLAPTLASLSYKHILENLVVTSEGKGPPVL